MSDIESLVVQYSVSDGAIAEIAERFKDAEASTTDGYKNVVAGIRCTRDLRVEVEARRKELKTDALVYGRKVDGEARRITDALLEVENPLKLLKEQVDHEKARAKRDAENKRLKEERQKLEEERATKEAEEKAIREAEEASLAEERKALKAEREKLDAEKRARAAEQNIEDQKRRDRQEAQDKERREKRLAEDLERAEKQRIEEEELEHRRREIEQLDQERRAREKAEKEAEEKRLEGERRKTELAELEKRRQVALPDVDKLKNYTDALLDLSPPPVVSPSGIAVLGQIERKLLEAQKLATDFAEELKD